MEEKEALYLAKLSEMYCTGVQKLAEKMEEPYPVVLPSAIGSMVLSLNLPHKEKAFVIAALMDALANHFGVSIEVPEDD